MVSRPNTIVVNTTERAEVEVTAMPATLSVQLVGGTVEGVGTGPHGHNELDIQAGSVVTGAPGTPADVNVTGSWPTYTISFVIPAGQAGAPGTGGGGGDPDGGDHVHSSFDINVGTVSSLPPGSNPTAAITGEWPAYTLSLGIPAGAPGADGEDGVDGGGNPAGTDHTHANFAIGIGTVTTLTPGANATASVTGTWPTLTLNLGIPAGSAGAAGATGQGVPTGGTAGQLLQKTSSANYATAWVDSPGGHEVSAGGTTGQVLTKNSATDYDYGWANPTSGGGGTGLGFSADLTVAATNATAAVKTASDYVCDGVSDQAQIQAAIDALAARTPVAGGIVRLSTGTFSLSAPIRMKTGVRLTGSGSATRIAPASGFAPSGSPYGYAMVQLDNTSTHATELDSIWLDGASKLVNGTNKIEAIWYTNVDAAGTAGSFAAAPDTDPDPAHRVHHLWIANFSGHGINTTRTNNIDARTASPSDATSGGCRGSHWYNLWIRGCGESGIVNTSPDSRWEKVISRSNSVDGFYLGGANNQYNQLHAYYNDRYNFQVTGTRSNITDCMAQDGGSHGWMLKGSANTGVNLRADSNGRSGTSWYTANQMAGFSLEGGSNNVYQGLYSGQRSGAGAGTQTYGVKFTTSMTGYDLQLYAEGVPTLYTGNPGGRHVELTADNTATRDWYDGVLFTAPTGSSTGERVRYVIATANADPVTRGRANLVLGTNPGAALNNAFVTERYVALLGPSVQLEVPITVNNTLDLYSNGTKLISPPGITLSAASRPAVFKLSGSSAAISHTVSGTTLALGAKTIAFTGAVTQLAAGDYIYIGSDETRNSNRSYYYKGEINRVEGVSGSTVTLATPLRDSYTVASITAVNKLTMPENVIIDGLVIEGSSASVVRQELMNIVWCKRPIVRNCTARGGGTYAPGAYAGMSASQGIGVWACIDPLVTDCLAEQILDWNGQGTYGDNTGYGFEDGGNEHAVFRNCVAIRCRHGFDSNNQGSDNYPVPRYGLVTGCVAYWTTNAPFATHDSESLTYQDCTAIGNYGGWQVRGLRTTIVNCKVVSPEGHPHPEFGGGVNTPTTPSGSRTDMGAIQVGENGTAGPSGTNLNVRNFIYQEPSNGNTFNMAGFYSVSPIINSYVQMRIKPTMAGVRVVGDRVLNSEFDIEFDGSAQPSPLEPHPVVELTPSTTGTRYVSYNRIKVHATSCVSPAIYIGGGSGAGATSQRNTIDLTVDALGSGVTASTAQLVFTAGTHGVNLLDRMVLPATNQANAVSNEPSGQIRNTSGNLHVYA